jgi:hypothetical protein
MGGGELTDSRLQELYAQVLARRDREPESGACVSPDDLLALARREGSEERRLEILDHAMTCNQCRRELALLQAIEAAGAAMQGTSRHRTKIWDRWKPLALAASVLLAVGLGIAVRQRSVSDDISRGGEAIQLLAPPSEVLPGQALVFIWHPLVGARRYRLEILDRADAVIFSGDTPDTTLSVLAGRLRPGEEYRWWVRDATPGAQRGSPLRRLRVRSQ